MTENQRKRFYFPAWHALTRALGWRMVRGRLCADLVQQLNLALALSARPEHPVRQLLPRIFQRAAKLAGDAHRAVTADDLRHACNITAALRCQEWRRARGLKANYNAHKTSSDALEHEEVDFAVMLFRLLGDWDSLAEIMDWDHPDGYFLNRIKTRLKQSAPESKLRAISNNAFNTSDWESLDMPKLQWLHREVNGRGVAAPRPTAGETCGEPF